MGKHDKKKGRSDEPKSKLPENSTDPKKCAHLSHVQDPEPKGGWNRYCPDCKTRWWTPD